MSTYQSKFKLNGKSAVVTGGTGLIGREVVTAFSEAGAKVIVADIDQQGGEELTALLRAKDYHVEFINFDITDIEGLQAKVSEVCQQCNVDVWVNCAYPRTSDWGSKVEDITAESWRKNVDMHLNSYSLSTKYVAESMKEMGGSIINLNSIYGIVGADFSVYQNTEMTMPMAYSAIKGGLANLTRYLASYFGPSNIRINSLCAGGVQDRQPQQFIEEYSKKTPLGRMAKADEIASAALFLASDASSYITGSSLVVDGGWTAI